MNKKQNIIASFIYLIIPFSYAISPYIALMLILLQSIVLVKLQSGYGNKFLIAFLNAMLFSCFSFLGLRLYDWIILISIVLLLVRSKLKIFVPRSAIAIFTIFVFNTIIHPIDSSTLLELERYTMSLMLMVIAVNMTFELDDMYDQMILMSFAALYNSVVVYFLIGLGKIQQLSSTFLSSNIYIYNQPNGLSQTFMQAAETRMNGFFSDPNKYMVFCFALLILGELLLKKNDGLLLRVVIIMASIVSLSRTALLVVLLYVVLKHMYRMKKRTTSIFVVEVVAVGIIGLVVLLFPSALSDIVNNLYDGAARLLGRTKTLEANSSIGNDNRVIVWNLALENIKNSIIFGHGWMSYERLLPYPTHNTLIELMLDGGVITTISYILFFMPLYKLKQWYLTLSCYLVPVMLLGLADYRMWFLILGIVLRRRAILGKEKSLYFRPYNR